MMIEMCFRHDNVRVMKSRFMLHYVSVSSYVNGTPFLVTTLTCQIAGSAYSVIPELSFKDFSYAASIR